MSLLNQLPAPPPGKTGWPWTEESNPAIYKKDITYPKISIVTPTYNQGAYIEESIRSLLLQNYPNLEYIITDGGSTDETVAIIKKYEPWLTYWVSEKDKGQSDAINKGIARSTGEWFNWLNSDDYYLKDALFYLSEKILQSSPQTVVVSANPHQLNLDGTITPVAKPVLRDKIYDGFVGTGYYQTPSLFSAKAVKIFGGVEVNLHYTMDVHLMLMLNLAGDVEKIEKDVMVTRLHNESKSVKEGQRFYKGWITAYSLLLNYFPKQYRDESLMNVMEKATGVSFKYQEQHFKPTRFTEAEYRLGQLYVAERIIALQHAYQQPGIDQLLDYMKKNHAAYYREAGLAKTKFINRPAMKLVRKIKNKLHRN